MKRNLFILILFSIIAPAAVFSQAVVITPKKTVYRRPKPLMDFKKSFTVIRPRVSGLSPALNKKVENTISYERVVNFNLREEIREVQWLEEASYEVNYNKNGILDITIFLEGAGAYPWVVQKTVVVDLKTGAQVRPQDVFTNLGELAAKAKKAQQAEMKKAREEYKKDPDSADFDASAYFDNADFTVKNLSEFTVSDDGVTFLYDYGFPHVVKALEPEGRFFYSWRELKPFIRRDGLLARFAR
ncbi:MAG: hypothetical protein M3384_10720 [Acidobacteriota bacterium]|nr:hypothetical protein [Acidobacteriota bacterium]